MKLIDSLIKQFGYNTPFMLSEIEKEDYSKQQIIKEVTKLCEAKKVIRFERGMYYIPRKTKFGTSFFNQNKVIEKKYISDGDLVYGYYSGRYIQKLLGLIKYNINAIDIFSNNASKDVTKITVGSQLVILHKARTTIDKHNAPVQCLLELMNGIDVETLDEYKRKLITDYIAENRITQKQITKYIPYFPDKTCRNLIESEVIYRVPQ